MPAVPSVVLQAVAGLTTSTIFSGNAHGMIFPVDAPSINATGATYVYWPPQPTLSGLTVSSRSTSAMAVPFAFFGHSYFQARYKATGTAGDFLSKGDNISEATYHRLLSMVLIAIENIE